VIPSLLVTGPGTGAGKTVVTRALASALRARGRRVAALKPVETGADPNPADALALARAAHDPTLAQAPAFFRARPPVAAYAAQLEGEAPPLQLPALLTQIRTFSTHADVLLVEGAGGLLAPIDAHHDCTDLARELELPLLLVARDQLGVLSYVLTCYESARARGLRVAAVILSRHTPDELDPSLRTNQRILQQRLESPIRIFPACPDDDGALATTAEQLGLLELLSLA